MKRFSDEEDGVCSVDLRGNLLGFGYVEAFFITLRDPAGQLVPSSDDEPPSCEPPAEGKIRLCTVRQGALCYMRTKREEAKPILKLGASSGRVREVICQRGGWTCAVLSGVGLVWVKVLSNEDDDVDSEFRVMLTINLEYRFEAFDVLFEHVSRHLSDLDLSCSNLGNFEPIFQTVLKHCVNLKYLVLADNELQDDKLDRLVEALRGGHADQLISLDPNGNRFQDVAFQGFAAFLGDPAHKTPALQELHLNGVEMSLETLSALQNMLRVNKKLCAFELARLHPGATGRNAEQYAAVSPLQKRIRAEHEGELLPASLDLTTKVAFLSVVGDLEARIHCSLDALIISTIFKFAADDV